MATSTVQVQFTITADTQQAADRIRDDAVIDYCRAYNLDIYALDAEGNRTETIDQAKAARQGRRAIMRDINHVFLGMAIQAGIAAILSGFGVISLSTGQQATAAILFVVSAVFIKLARLMGWVSNQ